jgi:hypothetical protein
VLTDRKRAAAFATFIRIMQDLLQLIDSDYYRSALLLMVRAELERIRQGHSALADVETPSTITVGTSRSAKSSIQSRELLLIV